MRWRQSGISSWRDHRLPGWVFPQGWGNLQRNLVLYLQHLEVGPRNTAEKGPGTDVGFWQLQAWCEVLRGRARSQGERFHRVAVSAGQAFYLWMWQTIFSETCFTIESSEKDRSTASINFSTLHRVRPDPRDDLGGTDVQRKVTILARELGLKIELDDVPVLISGYFWKQLDLCPKRWRKNVGLHRPVEAGWRIDRLSD